MQLQRSTHVSDHRVAEYFIGGRKVVYVDGQFFNGTYEQALAQFEEKKVSNG